MAPTNLCRLTFCCNFSCLRGAFFCNRNVFHMLPKMPRLRDAFSIKNGAPHRTYAFQTKANQRKQKLWRKKIKASVTQFQCGVKKGDFSFFSCGGGARTIFRYTWPVGRPVRHFVIPDGIQCRIEQINSNVRGICMSDKKYLCGSVLKKIILRPFCSQYL